MLMEMEDLGTLMRMGLALMEIGVVQVLGFHPRAVLARRLCCLLGKEILFMIDC